MDAAADRYAAPWRAAAEAVRQAAEACRTIRLQLDEAWADSKPDGSPVTVADLTSQALICRMLEQAFPDDPVVAEESSESLDGAGREAIRRGVLEQVARWAGPCSEGDVRRWLDRGRGGPAPSGRYWALDPLDGTVGYLAGRSYSVCLALIEGGRVQVAALGCPHAPWLDGAHCRAGLLATAVRGGGAWMAPLSDGTLGRRIEVRPLDEPGELAYCESAAAAHSWRERVETAIRRLGAAGRSLAVDSQVKYALVACGRVEAYIRVPRTAERSKVWDHAPGSLLVEEAGGRVTDLDGLPLDFSRPPRLVANRGLLATNGARHERLLEALRGEAPALSGPSPANG